MICVKWYSVSKTINFVSSLLEFAQKKCICLIFSTELGMYLMKRLFSEFKALLGNIFLAKVTILPSN